MTLADQLIESFARIVRADGGRLTLLAAGEDRIELSYAAGHDPDCASGACTLPHLELQDMMAEWLSRRAPGTRIVGRPEPSGSPPPAKSGEPE